MAQIGEARRGKAGAVNNAGSVDIVGVAATMTAMLAFTDSQLRTVWAAADRVPIEKRGVFVERVIARLQQQRSFTDASILMTQCA